MTFKICTFTLDLINKPEDQMSLEKAYRSGLLTGKTKYTHCIPVHKKDLIKCMSAASRFVIFNYDNFLALCFFLTENKGVMY